MDELLLNKNASTWWIYAGHMDVRANSSQNDGIITEPEAQDDSEYKHFYETAQFVTGLILYPIICTVGISGNILTLIVLNQHKMLTSTNVFLSALAVADLIKLLNDTLYFIVSILMRTNPIAGNQMMGYMYPFSHYIFNESVSVASWLTVCIGIERYLYVCHATWARELCTVIRARIISTVVFISMSLVAIPSALRYKRITVFDEEANRTKFEISLTALGQNESFMSVYMWTINLMRSVIPLCLLVVLNSCIIHSLRRRRFRKKIPSKNRITFMLIVVIVVFVVCITPDAVMSTVFGFGYVEAGYLVKGIRECTDMLLSINSAVNFTIYCLCSQGFRDIFHEVFCDHSCMLEGMGDLRKNSRRPLLNESTKCDVTWTCMKRESIAMKPKAITSENVTVGGGHQQCV